VIAAYMLWTTQLRSFNIDITVQPTLQIQQKLGQFGMYVTSAFLNDTYRSGYITQVCLLLAHSNSRDDRYLLTFNSFRIMSEDKSAFGPSEKLLPIYLQGKEQATRICNFLYDADEPFPLAAGVYNAELLVWTDWDEKADFSHEFSLLISEENAREYVSRKEQSSTRLIMIDMVGYAPLKSRKLSRNEYSGMR